MDSTSFCSYFCIILATMQEVVYCKQPCSLLEFPEVSEYTVHAKENNTINLRFHLNKNKCERIPEQWTILVMREKSGLPLNECTIRLKAGTCTLSDTSTACRCPSTDDNMLFLKRVTRSDGGVYVWRWWEKGSTANEKRITLHVSDADRELLTHPTDYQESTTGDQIQAGDLKTSGDRTAQDADAWKEHPGLGESTTGSLQHAGDLETGAVKSVDPYIDNRVIFIVTIATCVCLVVITTVITAGTVCCMKARRRHDQPHINPDLNFAFANLNGALRELNISRDQARDIYEEIPDPPKAHRTSRVSSTDNSRSRVKNPPIHGKEQEETTATQNLIKQAESCDSFDGYLHPAGVCSPQLDKKELAPV